MAFTIRTADPARLHQQLAKLNLGHGSLGAHLPPWRPQRDAEFAARVSEARRSSSLVP